jgi:hypothetical protein
VATVALDFKIQPFSLENVKRFESLPLGAVRNWNSRRIKALSHGGINSAASGLPTSRRVGHRSQKPSPTERLISAFVVREGFGLLSGGYGSNCLFGQMFADSLGHLEHI